VNAASLSPLPTLASTRANKLAFELRETSQYGEHQSTVRRRCVCPRIRQRSEPRSTLRYRVDDVEKVARRPSEPIKPSHDQGDAAGAVRLKKA
jgi:hypothetical protein